MVWRVRAQLLTFAPDESAYDVLLFPTWLHAERATSIRIAWLGRDGLGNDECGDLRQAIAILRKECPAHVNLEWQAPARAGGGPTRASGELHLSPLNRRWALPQEATRHVRAVVSLQESRKRNLAWNGIQDCPSLLDLRVTFEVTPTIEQGFGLVADGWPESLRSGVSGYFDVADESNSGVENILDELAPWPRAYPLLRTRFAGLHDLVVGPMNACAVVRDVCGPASRWAEISASADLALVSMPLDCRRAVPLGAVLVPRDDSTRQVAIDSGRGEFKVGGGVVFSERRRGELASVGILPVAPKGFQYAPLIREQDAVAAGIDPADMVTVLFQDQSLEWMCRAVDAELSKVSSGGPRERVWKAYQTVYRSAMCRRLDELKLIEGLFFPDLQQS
jgi:hypothetical protein